LSTPPPDSPFVYRHPFLDLNSWDTKGESGGGVLNNLTSHLISTLYWYFGEVNSVNAHTANWYSKYVEDYFHSILKFKSGLTGWIDSSWSVDKHRLPEATIEIHGTNGRLSIADDNIKLYLKKDLGGHPLGWSKWLAPDVYQGAEINIGGTQFTNEDKAFLKAIESGKNPDMDIKYGYEVQEIIDAIYKSGNSKGNSVQVGE